MTEDENPYSPRNLSTVTHTHGRSVVSLLLVSVPPITTLATLGLGAYIDHLTLGPAGFLIVLFLIGIGAPAFGISASAFVSQYLFRESRIGFMLLLVFEIVLVLFVYAIVRPLLGGWS